MGFGLGKNSPVTLTQSRDNFEALIHRHGQRVRWRASAKCPCVTETGRPDLRCEKCGGLGETYGFLREREDSFSAAARDGFAAIPDEFAEARILEILDGRGASLAFERMGGFVRIDEPGFPASAVIDARASVPLVRRVENVALEKAGGGYWRVPGLLVEPSKTGGGRPSGDLVALRGLRDSSGAEPKVLGLRRDMALVDADAESLFADSAEYVMPVRVVLLAQELSTADAAFVAASSGSALCVFPYSLGISEGDALTALSGAMIGKLVIEKRGGDGRDRIPEFHVEGVDRLETRDALYEEGRDFAIVGSNEIHWLGARPTAGAKMAITYRYFPTYRVAKEAPGLRTSGDQRIPRKAALQLFSAYSEARKLNGSWEALP
ncbi:MAG: hypothetical protein FWE09_00410 [Treponema sp.]|nr:hypothetical protein [Treponema sp.]